MKVLDLIGPEANFDGFELVSDDNSDDVSLIIGSILFVRGFFFDFINNTDHIYIFVLAKVGIMVPMEKFLGILVGDLFISDFMNLVLLVFEPDLR